MILAPGPAASPEYGCPASRLGGGHTPVQRGYETAATPWRAATRSTMSPMMRLTS
jgi:hypothetical protein